MIMVLTTISGDIIEYVDTGFIVHQCNCVTKTAKGLAKKIFEKYPETNIYIDNTIRKLGDVIIRGRIINLIGQYYPGKPKYKNDTSKIRENIFSNALKKISIIIPEHSKIYFPYNIGCGLAGGNWNNYFDIIKLFSENNPKLNIIIVRLE